MSTLARLTGAEFDSMVDRGAFDQIGPKKVELIHGELRFTNPAGPVHDDHIEYLTNWSFANTSRDFCNIRVQAEFVCDDNRPEPDIFWLRPRRYGRTRPTAADVMLLIEVSESSLPTDLQEKLVIYASGGIAEYWVVDVPNQRIYVLSRIENECYRSIEIATPAKTLSPICKPDAALNLSDLFAV